VQASTRIDSDAARSSVGEHTRGDLLLIRGGYFIRTLSIVPVSRVLSVSWGQGPLQRAFGYAFGQHGYFYINNHFVSPMALSDGLLCVFNSAYGHSA